MKNIFFLIPFLALLASCNLTKDVEVELPDYERQPVVECYLEPGKPYRLLLTRSYDFFAPFDTSLVDFITNIQIPDASVVILKDGVVADSLVYSPLYFDDNKNFNYRGSKMVPADYGSTFSLRIQLPDNEGTILAETVLPTLVEHDSIVVEWSPDRDTLARAITYFTENQSTVDFYRRLLNLGSLTDSFPDQDFLVSDRIFDTEVGAFGMGYELKEGDTLYNTLFHIEEAYYNYIESVQLAALGSINPFAQPSPIKSNVSGANALGIFTGLVYDRDTTVIRK